MQPALVLIVEGDLPCERLESLPRDRECVLAGRDVDLEDVRRRGKDGDSLPVHENAGPRPSVAWRSRSVIRTAGRAEIVFEPRDVTGQAALLAVAEPTSRPCSKPK